ncbi:hypothetical protein BDZ94DRAFT_1307308 [Collybia nuda]|uniref:Uncharacterized protein n=1 Tax=Collybia nuda TaxID=64659 RepID=A0A9P6CLX4_9AGAR|nr:hypothetical protein BDZ94DRAFT_1307308 [Collybia nuda]
MPFQAFFFNYSKPGEFRPIPVTEQCESVNITWSPISAADVKPTPPFYAQVFSSTHNTPFIIPAGEGPSFVWDVPFEPGTQYQICMYDRHGISGGCQAIYTVINSTSHANCQDMKTSANLSVFVTKPDGPGSQYGFIEQCADMTVTPTSGKPPFMLTIAPSLHPPFNITSDSMAPISWTASLSRGLPFFVALSSSDGQMWSMGPMHVSGPGNSGCLAPGIMSPGKVTSITVGVGIGSAVGGLGLGILSAYLAGRYRRRRARASITPLKVASLEETFTKSIHSLLPSPLLPTQYSRINHGLSGGHRMECGIEPFMANSPSENSKLNSKGSLGSLGRIAIETVNSPRRNTWSRLGIVSYSGSQNSVEPPSSAPTYSVTPNSEYNIELPPKYVVNPMKKDKP